MTEALQPGQNLGGRWTLVSAGAATDVGTRYEARGAAGEACVLHAFPTSLFGVQGAWQSFQRDARASTGLATDVVAASSVLVRTYEAQVDAQLGVPYAVIEAVSTPSLEAHVAANGPLGAVQVALLLEGLAPALDAAHAAGLVHGCLDPANVHVRLGAPPELRIEEFGFAHLRATAFPGWRARPRFASPEAPGGAAPSPATDVHGLGVLAFYAMVGKSPFLAAQGANVDPAALAREFSSPLAASARAQQLGSALPGSLDPFFAKALDPDPTRRFGSPSELAKAFGAAAAGGPTAAAGKKQFASTMLLGDAPRGGPPRPAGAPRPASPRPPTVQPTPATAPLGAPTPGAAPSPAVVVAPPPIVPAPPTMIGSGTPQPPPAAVPGHGGLGVDAPTPIEVPSPFHAQPAPAPGPFPGASPAPPLAATPTPYTATPPASPPQDGGPVAHGGVVAQAGYGAGAQQPPGAPMPFAMGAQGSSHAAPMPGPEAWRAGEVDPMAAAMAAETAASLAPPRKSSGLLVPLVAIGGLFVLGGIAAAAVWAFTSRAGAPAASATAAPAPPAASATAAETPPAVESASAAPAASEAPPAASAEPPANPLVKLDCGEPGCGAVRCDEQPVEIVDSAFRLPPGKHACVVDTEGYQPKKLTLTVVAGRDLEQKVALTKKREAVAAAAPPSPPPASKVPAKPPAKKCGTFIKCK